MKPFSPQQTASFHLLTQIHRTSTYTYIPHLKLSGSDFYHLTTLSDRLAALELTVQKLIKPKPTKAKTKTTANYAWTTEINTDDGIERKYPWSAKLKGGEEAKDKKIDVKNYKWSSEIKGSGEHAPVYFTV